MQATLCNGKSKLQTHGFQSFKYLTPRIWDLVP